MAIVDLDPTVLSTAGTTPSYAAISAVTDVLRVRNPGNVMLHFKNTNGSSRTVTVDVPATVAGQSVPDFSYTVPAQVAASTTGVHAAHTDDSAPEVLTTGITNPTRPARITATAGGTSGDIKAIQVTITGTDAQDRAVSEVLPAFTENTPGTVTGNVLFKTVTQIDIPAHDGNGATTATGWADIPGEVIVPPLPGAVVNDDAGNIVFSVSAVTGLTVAAIQLA